MIQVVEVTGIVLAVVLLILLSSYNSLMHLRQQVRAAWAQMDDQLKKRYELIPELAATLQAIGGEAASKLPAISAAKNQAAVAFSPAQLAAAETALSEAIHDLLRLAATDAVLNANPNFSDVRQRLVACEKQISRARAEYNDRVAHLNEARKSFPAGITAMLIGLKPQPVFELPGETG